MPAYPMGKMGNCPGPRAQGGPALAEGVIANQRKRGKEKGQKRGKKGKKEIKWEKILRKNERKKLEKSRARNC